MMRRRKSLAVFGFERRAIGEIRGFANYDDRNTGGLGRRYHRLQIVAKVTANRLGPYLIPTVCCEPPVAIKKGIDLCWEHRLNDVACIWGRIAQLGDSRAGERYHPRPGEDQASAASAAS